MPVVDAKQLLSDARAGGYGVGAFNITNLEEIASYVAAAEKRGVPMIVQVTQPVAEFLGAASIAAVFESVAGRSPVPLVLHLDHTRNPDYVVQCASLGFGSVMFDGSHLPIEENIAATRRVVEAVHERSAAVNVEGELGVIGGKEDGLAAGAAAGLCEPADAVRFVQETMVSAFAPAIGTVHGFYKTADPAVDFVRVDRIAEELRSASLGTALVVHGGTGLSAATFRRLVAAGYCKINISTQIKKTLIDTTYEYISGHRSEYDPPKIDAAVRAAVIECVVGQIDLVGTPPLFAGAPAPHGAEGVVR